MSSFTVPDVLIALRDFLVIWISQIVYYTHIYPNESFAKKLYLDLVVYQCRAPALNEYLEKFAIEMIEVLAEKDGGGNVHEVLVLVYDETSLHVRQRFIINFSQFSGLKGQFSSLDFLLNANLIKDTQSAKINVPGFTRDKVYTNLRSLMFLHLEELKRTEAPTPNDLFFKLLLNVDDEVDLNKVKSQPSPWIRLISDKDDRKIMLVPLGEMSVGFMRFDIHNEYIND